jgi:hypothetical protein
MVLASGRYRQGTTNVIYEKLKVMKKTLYIPDDLWEQLNQYLQENPGENVSSVVQGALKEKLRPRNGVGLSQLAGIVNNAPSDASVNPTSRV